MKDSRKLQLNEVKRYIGNIERGRLWLVTYVMGFFKFGKCHVNLTTTVISRNFRNTHITDPQQYRLS